MTLFAFAKTVRVSPFATSSSKHFGEAPSDDVGEDNIGSES